MTENDPYAKMKALCRLLGGHDSEFFDPGVGMCYACKSVNPRFEDD